MLSQAQGQSRSRTCLQTAEKKEGVAPILGALRGVHGLVLASKVIFAIPIEIQRAHIPLVSK